MISADLEYISSLGKSRKGKFTIEACPTQFDRNSVVYVDELLKQLKQFFPDYSLHFGVSYWGESERGIKVISNKIIPENEYFSLIPEKIEGKPMEIKFHSVFLKRDKINLRISTTQHEVTKENGQCLYGIKNGIGFGLETKELSELSHKIDQYQQMISLCDVSCEHTQVLLNLKTEKEEQELEAFDDEHFIGITRKILSSQKLRTRREFAHQYFHLVGIEEWEDYTVGASAAIEGLEIAYTPFFYG
jgi:hypothetical protein